MHNMKCQLRNGILRTKGAGCGAGEPPEMGWAKLGRYAKSLQYKGEGWRHDSLEFAILNFNLDKQMKLVPLLVGMIKRAFQRRAAGVEDKAKFLASAAAYGISLSTPIAARDGDSVDVEDMSDEMLYVLTLLRHKKLARLVDDDDDDLPGIELIMEDREVWRGYRTATGAKESVRLFEVRNQNLSPTLTT